MLHEFLSSNRRVLIARCREKVAKRAQPAGVPATENLGVPLFLEQLVDVLRREQTQPAALRRDTAPAPFPSALGRSAALQGSDMLRQGYNIGQVVHGYGDVCQSVTELAVEQSANISPDEFRTLNRCLDDAIADAVTAFNDDRQVVVDHATDTVQARLDHFLHEQRRLIDIAIQSFTAMRGGTIGFSGSTGTLLQYTLSELRTLAERTLPALGDPKPPALLK